MTATTFDVCVYATVLCLFILTAVLAAVYKKGLREAFKVSSKRVKYGYLLPFYLVSAAMVAILIWTHEELEFGFFVVECIITIPLMIGICAFVVFEARPRCPCVGQTPASP